MSETHDAPADAPRILLAKPGLDGHDRGVKVVAHALRDAGYRVSYTGLRQSVEAILEAARREEVDCIGLSILSGSHRPLCEKMQALRAEQGLGEVLWIVGGNIPAEDRPALEALGVDRVFPTGTPFEEIVAFLDGALRGGARQA
jgi:methylmalonyl-CoA mutase C-terminal domain/subunit